MQPWRSWGLSASFTCYITRKRPSLASIGKYEKQPCFPATPAFGPQKMIRFTTLQNAMREACYLQFFWGFFYCENCLDPFRKHSGLPKLCAAWGPKNGEDSVETTFVLDFIKANMKDPSQNPPLTSINCNPNSSSWTRNSQPTLY